MKTNDLESLKSLLRARVDEWIGADIPDSDDEDYQKWQSMIEEIEGITDVEGVKEFIIGNRMGDIEDLFST